VSGQEKTSFSPSGSFLTTSSPSTGNASTVTLHELDTMTTKIQSVDMPGFAAACIAVTDSKQLAAVGDHVGKIGLLQTDNFSIQRDFDRRALILSVALILLAESLPLLPMVADSSFGLYERSHSTIHSELSVENSSMF
jgi:hypothetical protein